MNHESAPSSAAPLGISRRSFLESASALAGITASSLVHAEGSTTGKAASKPIGVGFAGVGNRGLTHLQFVMRLQEQGLAKPIALYDAYAPRAKSAADISGARICRNFDELLNDPAVDAIAIATPDRHHAGQAIEAVRRGKDVFVEKPLTHWSQYELAKLLADEATKHGRIVQVGSQFVADPAYGEIIKAIQEGAVGKIVHVQAGYFRRGDWGERMHIPNPSATPGPELDWEAFLGDAPPAEFSVSRFFQWRLFWDYAGGPATDLLFHVFTPISMVLQLGEPHRVMCGGGTFQYDREVPDQCNIVIDYADGPSVVLMNSLSNHVGIDTILRGTDGIITWKQVNDPSSKGARIVSFKKGVEERFIPWQGMGDPMRLWENFIDCIATRRQPVCPVSLAAQVQLPLTMAVLAHRDSTVMEFDRASRLPRAQK